MSAILVGIGIVGISLLGVSLIPITVGFTTKGIAAGSIAAGVHSMIGNAVSGSLFSIFQSLGMSGFFATMASYGITIASASGAGILFTTKPIYNRLKNLFKF